MSSPDAQSIWNQRYARQEVASDEDWLQAWDALLPRSGTALDLGCGDGFETARLLSRSLAVTAVDIAEQALARSRQRNPQAQHLVADARQLHGLADASFDLVLAHLSLHYFDKADSLRAFGEVARVLKPQGLLLAGLNADDDVNYGAPPDASGWALTPVDGVPKQFFTEAKLQELLIASGLQAVQLRKRSSLRYGAPKSLWELAARKTGG